jgi:hypothetical protein
VHYPRPRTTDEATKQIFGKNTAYIRSGGSIPIMGMFDREQERYQIAGLRTFNLRRAMLFDCSAHMAPNVLSQLDQIQRFPD